MNKIIIAIAAGEPTPVEVPIQLVNLFEEDTDDEDFWERDDVFIPHEDTVMEVAEAWSINPCSLGTRTDVEGLGILGRYY